MDLTGPIKSAENQFKQILEAYFISVYDEKSLPSHGIDHHRRVWNYAKELLSLNNKLYPAPDSPFINSLIIACYLHDIGMSVDPGPRHGSHSMELCKSFLHKHVLAENNFPGLLNAIRDHDNKEYENSSAELSLSSVLSVADDLDAFGFTGIYRYLEIYIIRGYEPETLGSRIRENAAKRFGHFEKCFGFSRIFSEVQKKKYLILDGFFSEYNKELKSQNNNKLHKLKHKHVVEVIIDVIRLRKDPCEYLSEKNYSDRDPVVKWFFDGLKTESQGLSRDQTRDSQPG